MRIAYLLYVSIIGLAAACDLSVNGKPKELPQKMDYSFECLDSAVSGSETSKAIRDATSVIRNLAIKQKGITDSIQNEWGIAFHEDAIETKTFVLMNDATIYAQLQEALNDLLAVRKNPSKIDYSIYLLNDSAINAFTFGGHIYLTKGMYDRCKDNTDLLYSIIGHEIGHSEKGHIKKKNQQGYFKYIHFKIVLMVMKLRLA